MAKKATKKKSAEEGDNAILLAGRSRAPVQLTSLAAPPGNLGANTPERRDGGAFTL